jgi:hypothetical protein
VKCRELFVQIGEFDLEKFSSNVTSKLEEETASAKKEEEKTVSAKEKEEIATVNEEEETEGFGFQFDFGWEEKSQLNAKNISSLLCQF